MKKTCFIPARYDSIRFPAKLMQTLGDKTVIRTTYEAVESTGLFDDVIVVTDSSEIFAEITAAGGRALMSRNTHHSGSDRIAEVAADIETDIVINVQGDTPFITKDTLKKLIDQFGDPSVQVCSPMRKITDGEDIPDPNFVKVVVDKHMNALFFSRSVIPYPRDRNTPVFYYKHIGVYAYRKQALLDFTLWPTTILEQTEQIECLRFLENGVPIRMVVVAHSGIEIDTAEDLEKANAYLAGLKK